MKNTNINYVARKSSQEVLSYFLLNISELINKYEILDNKRLLETFSRFIKVLEKVTQKNIKITDEIILKEYLEKELKLSSYIYKQEDLEIYDLIELIDIWKEFLTNIDEKTELDSELMHFYNYIIKLTGLFDENWSYSYFLSKSTKASNFYNEKQVIYRDFYNVEEQKVGNDIYYDNYTDHKFHAQNVNFYIKNLNDLVAMIKSRFSK